MLGQIATFMGDLNLSYREVVEEIPYRNLVIMHKDRLRVTYGEVMVEVPDGDFFKNKKFDE